MHALKIPESSHKSLSLSMVYERLGRLYGKGHDFKKAEDFLSKALKNNNSDYQNAI